MAKILNNIEEINEILKCESKIIIDFFAEWCGPCRSMAVYIDEYAIKYKNSIKFYRINVGEQEELAKKFNIEALPTFQFFKDGIKTDELVGASVNSLSSLCEKNK